MTFPRHWLLSFGGRLFNNEQWTNNIRFVPGGLGVFEPISNYEGALNDLEADIRTHFARASVGYSGAVVCEWIKFNEIDENGRYADPTTTHARYLDATTEIKNATAAKYPHGVAAAVTFTTARQRGQASKGRVFIPSPSMTMDAATGLINSGARDAAVTAWTAFIQDLGNWPGLDYTASPVPAVVSKVGTGHAEPITGVRVGNVFDSQRRRRAQLDEEYSAGAV